MSLQLRKRIKMTLAAWLVRGFRRPRLTSAEVVRLTPQRVLIVRQHNQMGDMVCATPTFRALRRTYPRAELALVCAPLNLDVVNHNPDLDHVFVFDKKIWRRPHRLWRFWRQLRQFRPDVAFVLNSVSFSVTSVGLAVASGAPILVGGDSRPFGWDLSRHVYSLEMPTRPDPDQHAVRHGLASLQAIGITTEDVSTLVVPSPHECGQAEDFLARHGKPESYWVIHPGAGKRENLWPATRFAAVAARAAASGQCVLVLQGPADGVVMQEFWTALHEESSANDRSRIVAVPPMTVGVCAALLAGADRFLCNDTGMMHVAGAVGVTTLALFGPTDPAIWKPLGDHVVGLRGEAGRIENLQVAAVWRTLTQLGSPQTGVSSEI
jgi:heptosyltransferase-2